MMPQIRLGGSCNDRVPHARGALRGAARFSVRAALPDAEARPQAPLLGRRAARWAGRLPAPRRADLVLPVPTHDPAADRRRVPGGRAGPDRVRQVGQAAGARKLFLRGAGRLDRRMDRGAGPARHDAGLPGLGIADRAAPGGGNARALPWHCLVQRRPARRAGTTARLRDLARLLPLQPGLPDRRDREARHEATAEPARGRRLRRPLPHPRQQGSGAGLSRPGALRRQSRRARPAARLAGIRALGKPVPVLLRRWRPDHARGDAMWLERVPGTRGMAHRTLRGGHFIQEDDPAGFAAAIAEVARTAASGA